MIKDILSAILIVIGIVIAIVIIIGIATVIIISPALTTLLPKYSKRAPLKL